MNIRTDDRMISLRQHYTLLADEARKTQEAKDGKSVTMWASMGMGIVIGAFWATLIAWIIWP